MNNATSHQRRIAEQDQRVLDALRLLMMAGQDGAYMIVESGRYYVQFKKLVEDEELWCEAVSNWYLPRRLRINPEAQKRLLHLGFHEPEGDFHNFHRFGSLDQAWDALYPLATMVVSIMLDVYQVSPNADLGIEVNLEG